MKSTDSFNWMVFPRIVERVLSKGAVGFRMLLRMLHHEVVSSASLRSFWDIASSQGNPMERFIVVYSEMMVLVVARAVFWAATLPHKHAVTLGKFGTSRSETSPANLLCMTATIKPWIARSADISGHGLGHSTSKTVANQTRIMDAELATKFSFRPMTATETIFAARVCGVMAGNVATAMFLNVLSVRNHLPPRSFLEFCKVQVKDGDFGRRQSSKKRVSNG